MGAHFLASLCGAKDPDDRYFGLFGQLLRPDIVTKLGVIFGWRCLIEVDAILALRKSAHVLARVARASKLEHRA